MGKKLTKELLQSLLKGADLASTTEVSLANNELEDLGDLDACPNLTRLDLSGNHLENVEALSSLRNLKWLSVSANNLASLEGIEKLKKLTVLNCSKNKLSTMCQALKLKELRALIMNDNQIDSLPTVNQLVNLNTLVLSHNPIKKLGDSISKLSMLTKLSLSHCKLRSLGTSLVNCITLEELRLSHNQLKVLPKEMELNAQLRIIDVGNNSFKSWKDIEVLALLPKLVNLNLRGNPLCEESSYAEKVNRQLPKLNIFDGRPTQNSATTKGSKRKRNKGTLESDDAVDVLTPNLAEKDNNEKSSSIQKADRPFPAAGNEAKRGAATSEKESKVVSIKRKRNRKRAEGDVSGSMIAHALSKQEVGAGGPSAWDP